jgi:Domain of unknown function (DUF2520)
VGLICCRHGVREEEVAEPHCRARTVGFGIDHSFAPRGVARAIADGETGTTTFGTHFAVGESGWSEGVTGRSGDRSSRSGMDHGSGRRDREGNELSSRQEWREGIVFHCSGALTSDELEPLRKQGAKAASVHPVMTFAANTVPSLQGVAFGIEGDAAAVRLAKQIVRDLGGVPVEIRKENKVLYHVLGAFASPMLIALMAALEDIGMAAGFEPRQLRAVAGPLLRQTLENYLERGAAAAFTGPFVRGDVAVIRRHLSHLEEVPLARDVYLSLARAAVENLPVKDRDAMRKVLGRKK